MGRRSWQPRQLAFWICSPCSVACPEATATPAHAHTTSPMRCRTKRMRVRSYQTLGSSPAVRQLPDALDGLEDVIEGVGIAESEVPRSVFAERRPVETGDARLVQEQVRERPRLHPRAAHVRK